MNIKKFTYSFGGSLILLCGIFYLDQSNWLGSPSDIYKTPEKLGLAALAQQNRIESPNNRYFAQRTVSGNNAHYQVFLNRGKADAYLIFTTYAEYSTPNDVKVGIFSSDSQFFAAAYHYGHRGAYTWIGIWRTDNGKLIATRRVRGWTRNISWIFGQQSKGVTQQLPDLRIVNITWQPNERLYSPGTTIRFSIQVRNQGNANVNGYILVVGSGNSSGGFRGLEAGETKTARLDYPLYSPMTTYTMSFSVDPENVIQESNENNNSTPSISLSTHY